MSSSGPQADLDINVNDRLVYPEGTIVVDVTVVPRQKFQAFTVDIELVQSETYWFHKPHETPFTMHGPLFVFNPIFWLLFESLYRANVSYTDERERHEYLYQREQLLFDIDLSMGSPIRTKIRFPLPSDPPPSDPDDTIPAHSLADSIPEVTWYVRAKIYDLQTRRRWWGGNRSHPVLLQELRQPVTILDQSPG